jgi:ABC-type sugar transport system substrate-binding protein
MYTKKLFIIVSVLVMLSMALGACAQPTAAPTKPAAPEKPAAPAETAAPAKPAGETTIAGVVFQDDQFMNSMVKGFTDAGAKYGVKVLTANTNNDQAKEAELIQTYMAQGVNGIAIAPLSKDASIANLKEADAQGIKVAITNMSISDPSFLAGGFTSDDRSNGKIVGENAAKFIKEKLGGTAKVAIVDFDHQLPDQSKARYGGFEDGLKEAGVTYEVLAHQSANLQEDALAKTSDMLTAHPEIQVIFASNEGGTIGAAMAVKQAGLAGKVAVFGYDGSDQLTSMILSGDNILQGVVAQDPYSQGYRAVEALAKAIKGEATAEKGVMTIVPGTYLSTSDLEAVNTWRTSNGLPALEIKGAAPSTGAVKDLTVAGIVFQDDQFMNSLTQGYVDAGAKYGVKVLTANTNNDQAKEAELIQTYMAQGVNGIAIAPLSPDASIANLKEADAKGIKVAITNMSISDPSFLVAGYTSDDRSNGKIVGENAAKFIQEKLGGAAKVAIVDFDHQLPDQSKARYGGFEDGLKEAGVTYEVVAHQSANLQEDALAKTSDMLTAHPEIQVIFASNEGGTVGAAMAVKQAGLAGKVYVFGYDGSDQTTSMVLDSDDVLQGVVTQDPYHMGYNAVEALVKYLSGETVADQGTIVIVPGQYLGRTDLDAVKAWRTANGLQ